MFEEDRMRVGTLVLSGLVGIGALVVVALLALGFGVSLERATGQALPLVLVVTLTVGLLVTLERRPAR
jgi:hypothetical protein